MIELTPEERPANPRYACSDGTVIWQYDSHAIINCECRCFSLDQQPTLRDIQYLTSMLPTREPVV